MIYGLLISQIGYDLYDPMQAIYRAEKKDFLSGEAYFEIADIVSAELVKKEAVEYWGEIWKTHWWVLDFTGLAGGEYEIMLYDGDNLVEIASFEVGNNLLWNITAVPVGINQFEKRAERARNQIGWKDCGATLRESVSHAIALIGLTEFLLVGFEWLGRKDCQRERTQLMQGADYLMVLAKKAVEVGYPKGSLFHEIPRHMLILPRSISQSIIAWTRVSKLIVGTNPIKSAEYLAYAKDSFEYYLNGLKPHGPRGFSISNHGAPKDYEKPDEWETRDLILWMWAGVELVRSGLTEYLDEVVRLADMIMERQVTKKEAEDGLYGHFFAFSDRAYTGKANTHHHIGHDTGGVFPYYITAFIDLIQTEYDHPNVEKWRQTVNDFANGFYLPACSKNPFYIVPEGYFAGEGLLNFCGPWHGMNATIAFGATLALKLEAFTGNNEFRKISVGCIQWIAGLNVGVTKNSFESTLKFKMALDDETVIAISQIFGIGKRYAKCWSDIKGTVMNGFSANPQFRLVIEPTLENDYPTNFTDEDWVPHGAAYVGALANLRMQRYFSQPEQQYE